MGAMSLLMLAQAADFVEYQKDCKARGEDPVDHNTFSKLCAANPDGLHNLFQQPIEPRKTQPTPTSHSSPEDSRERRRSSSGLGKESSLEHPGITREVHNKLEKNRRAHLKECFEILRKTLPNLDDRKTSNLSILRNAHRYIQTLKRKERDSEHELERLAREKISLQQRLSVLKKEVSAQIDNLEVNNYTVPDEEDDNETTTTASECGSLNDFDDNEEQNSAALNSSISSNFANSSSSSTASSVLVGPISSVSASLAFTKPVISGAQLSISNKESVASPNHFVHETRLVPESKNLLSSVPPPVSVQISSSDTGTNPAAARIFSTGNLHTMAGIFAAPHAMQVISQSSGIKVITTPNSIMTSNSSVQHISVNHHQHSQIHVLTPSSNASYVSSMASAKTFSADSLVQMASGSGKGISKPHLVSPLALVSPQTMVELSHGNSGSSNSTNLSELISSSGISNLSKGNSVLSGNMAIAVKSNLTNNSASTSSQSNMITALHVSKPHSQVIQPSLTSSIITQGGSHVNNGNHHGVTAALKSLTSNHVRSLPHIAGIAHVVSQSPISAPVGQIVTPGSHVSAVTPLVGSVSVVSHTGSMHQQSLGKVLASPVLKPVNQMNSIPIIQQQFLQQVSMGSSNQSIVKPVVVVSMPNVVPSANMSSLTPTSIVTMNDQTGIVRGSVTQK